MGKRQNFTRQALLLGWTTGALIGGAAFWLTGKDTPADAAWAAAIVAALVPLAIGIARDLLHGKAGVDLVALLALIGSLILQELFAGAVVAVMVSSGWMLEQYAARRAERELSALLERAPRVVHRYADGVLTSPDLADVRTRDRLMVKPGEVVPVDGVIASDSAMLDESALTGESRLVERQAGAHVQSGVANAGGPFDMIATTGAEESTYAGIVRLVSEAQASKAPFVRMADRYALLFVPLTVAIGLGAWAASGDPVRLLAVLVVATPCPLIIAAPVAIMSGISRAARRGIVMKDGAALEALAAARALLFDKTGTLTMGKPSVTEVVTPGPYNADEVLRLAASVDQFSTHVLADAIVAEARRRRLKLDVADDVREEPGRGTRGNVDGHAVTVGRADWVVASAMVPEWAWRLRRRTAWEGSINVFVGADGAMSGALILEDTVRPDAARTLRSLRNEGVERIVMVTGDHLDVAETVGAAVGVDEVLAERGPAEKIEAVQEARRSAKTMMVGDGINDAPALAAADVGIAMGARGATASSEAADIVIVVDRLERLAEAVQVAHRARAIAEQSVVLGMGMSVAAMIAAAFGLIPPAVGAVVQEAIDVAVILNALRALGGYRSAASAGAAAGALSERFRDEHAQLLPIVSRIRTIADRLDVESGKESLESLSDLRRQLIDDLLPHESAEEASLYPVVARMLGGEDPTGTMARAHVEIAHQARLLGRLLDDLPPSGPGPDDRAELRRVLYGLYAILRLHFAQEEEAYLSLFDVPASSSPGAANGQEKEPVAQREGRPS